MIFALSVLYFVTYYLTPATIFGPLTAVHIEMILAVVLLVVSLPTVAKTSILKTPQSVALIGMAFAVFLSVLIAVRWPGGAVQAFFDFIPNIFAFFLVCLHCNSKKKMQVVILMMLFVCLFVIAHGAIDLSRGVSGDAGTAGSSQWDAQHPYVLAMGDSAGAVIYRIRGLGEINDPNDFGQVVVCVIPLMFIFWRPKKIFRNSVLVLLPVCVLLYGVFLTHSRGALLALLAVGIVAGRRRIGTLPSALLAGGLFVAAMALNFTGGRDISVDAGSGRTELWGESMELLKSHPLFGVGFGSLPDYLGHTAHNSVAVCAAELGLFGLYFWSLFLLPTARDVLAVASPAKVSEGEPVEPEEELYPQAARKIEAVDKAEINNLGRLLVLSLTGFLVTGWFLSRAFVLTLFLLGGMVEVVFQMALQRGMIAPRLRMPRALRDSGILAVSLVLLMYIMLRTVNLMH
jgi:O-antigen ligase